jgi:type I restriction enzyme S subunit
MSLDQLLSHLASGSRDWSKYYNQGNGTFLMAQNIRRTGLDLSFRQVVGPPPDDRDRARSQVVRDDILVTIVGGNTGDVCIVPRELPEHFVCQSVALVRLAVPKLSRFISLYLAADEDGQEQWRRMIYGAGRPHLGFEHLRATVVPIPPVAEQAAIVSEVDRRLAAANRLAATLEQQLNRARATRHSLLREAFSGRLIPQNPDDEPAALMLRRIGAARALSARESRGKRMSKTKSQMKPAHRTSLLAVLKQHGGPMTPEELFHMSGHSEESVDEFFAELRELTTIPAKIAEERTTEATTLLRALP